MIKVTVENLLDSYPKVESKLPIELTQEWEVIREAYEYIDTEEEFRETIELFVQKIHEYFESIDEEEEEEDVEEDVEEEDVEEEDVEEEDVEEETEEDVEEETEEKPKPKKPKQGKAKKTKAEKKPKEKKKYDGEWVNSIDKEVAYITRFCKLNGKKTKDAKVKVELNRFLKALQKSIMAREIRKSSKYADTIMNIQKALISMINSTESHTIEITNYDELKSISKSQKVKTVVDIIRSFIHNLEGQTKKQAKAEALLNEIAKLPNNHEYQDEIAQIQESLENYIDGKTSTPKIPTTALSGLYSICDNKKKSLNGIISSSDFIDERFKIIPFKGKWERLIGKPAVPFKIMIHGAAGSGKSTLSLAFAKYLADLGERVLYVASEEKLTYTLQEKIKRMNAISDNLFIVGELPKEIEAYDVIFIDSVNDAQLDPEYLQNISGRKSWVYVFQATKDGKYKGEQQYAHDVDVVIKVEDLKAQATKNRFGGKEIVDVL